MRSASSPRFRPACCNSLATMEVPERCIPTMATGRKGVLVGVPPPKSLEALRSMLSRDRSTITSSHVSGSPSWRWRATRDPTVGAGSESWSSVDRQSYEFPGNLIKTVEGQRRLGGVNVIQLTVDCPPKRGGIDWIGLHHGSKAEPGKSLGPQHLLFRSWHAGHDDRTLAKVHRLGQRIVASHADDGIGGVDRGGEIRIEVEQTHVGQRPGHLHNFVSVVFWNQRS